METGNNSKVWFFGIDMFFPGMLLGAKYSIKIRNGNFFEVSSTAIVISPLRLALAGLLCCLLRHILGASTTVTNRTTWSIIPVGKWLVISRATVPFQMAEFHGFEMRRPILTTETKLGLGKLYLGSNISKIAFFLPGFHEFQWEKTPPQNMSPFERNHFKRMIVFQPAFFRGYVSFRGCNSQCKSHTYKTKELKK